MENLKRESRVTIPELMGRLAPMEGINPTRISQVRLFKASQYQPRQPLCYDQGVIIVGQGTKRVFLGEDVYEYNPDNYLVLSVPLPGECETQATHGIKDACLRLLQALQSPVESHILGPSIIHELTFRILCGENGAALHDLAMKNTNLSRVDKALKLIHGNYNRPMDVDQLSSLVHMSPSAFHRAFKEVTASSPIQYLKKIRLDKARALISNQGLRVNEAAAQVGYESPTQFSREFKRYFGTTPVSFLPGRSPGHPANPL